MATLNEQVKSKAMMKINVAVTTQEEFLSGFEIKLENGLILRTFFEDGGNLTWAGIAKKAEAIAQFDEFIAELEAAGFNVEGQDILDKHRRKPEDAEITECKRIHEETKNDD